MTYLKLYAKLLKKSLALTEILKDIKPLTIKELKRFPDMQAVKDGVEFHMTTKSKKEYPDDVKLAIEALRTSSESAGHVKITSINTLDAYVPKSVKDTVLARASADYRKHFRIAINKTAA
jgi:hypothetical protein